MAGRWAGAACLVLLVCSGVAQAQTRQFVREDYSRYFSPGRFLTESTYHQSLGVLDITSRRNVDLMGRFLIEQTIRTLTVSRNYDVLSDFPFYKIEASGVENMLWDAGNESFLFQYRDVDFDASAAVAWESHNDRLEITDGDRNAGPLNAFYRRADRRARQDAEALDQRYRSDVVGAWAMQCFFIENLRYDVECTNTHLPTQRVERHFYKKLDLVS